MRLLHAADMARVMEMEIVFVIPGGNQVVVPHVLLADMVPPVTLVCSKIPSLNPHFNLISSLFSFLHLACDSSSTCSGHGSCDGNGNCACDSRWQSSGCASCTPGHYGPSCDAGVC